MKKKALVVVIAGLSLGFSFSCFQKGNEIKKSNPYKSPDKQAVLEKANKNFEELEVEADKKPEDLTLPDYSKKKTIKAIPEKPKTKTAIKKYIPPKEKIFKVKTKYPIKNGYPVWVFNPNYNGYLGAVGIAKKIKGKGYPEQKRIAVMVAKSNLAKQIRLVVNSEVYTEKLRISRKDYEEYKSKLRSLSKHSAHAYLKNVVVKDEWIDPKTGDLYVWVVLEK